MPNEKVQYHRITIQYDAIQYHTKRYDTKYTILYTVIQIYIQYMLATNFFSYPL